MKMGTKFKYFTLSLGGLLMLSGCGGGDDAPAAAKPYYFAGTTKTSGKELWKTDGTEAGTVLVKEINEIGSSYPSNFIEAGGNVYFTADDAAHGVELWKSGAEGVSLVKDIHPSDSSNPHGFVAGADGGKLYFIADDKSAKNGLWVTDGTGAGTVKIGGFAGVENLMVANTSLFFTTENGSILWKFDGVNTPSDPVAAGVFTDAKRLTMVGADLYFIANSGYGFELWTSNGADTATMVADLCAGVCDGLNPASSKLYNVNDALFFTRYDRGLYSLDGDGAPVVLRDAGDVQLSVASLNDENGVSDGVFYFKRNDGRLWRTDGIPANTVQLTSNSISNTTDFQPADGGIFFRSGNGVWKSNGTMAGTVNIYYDAYVYAYKVTAAGSAVYVSIRDYETDTYQLVSHTTDGSDVSTTLSSSTLDRYRYLSLAAGKLYMSHRTREQGSEPWVSDSTVEGTVLLANVNAQPSDSSYPYGKVELDGLTYFVASDDNDNYNLWKTDGTSEGTVQLTKDLYEIYGLAVSGGKIYFVGDDSDHGNELWVSDGTEAGTGIVIDLATGTSGSYPHGMVDANGTLYFIDNDNNFLWKTDGTLEGTLPVSTVNVDSSQLIAVGSKVYFVCDGCDYDGYSDEELWVSDGTYAGTRMVKDIAPYDDSVDSSYFGSRNAKAIGDILYFVADDDGVNGRELWRTDGTEAGTWMVINLNGSNNGVSDYNQYFYAAGETLYFIGRTSNGDDELWKTDGTEEGTKVVTDFGKFGGQINYWNGFAVYGDNVYFSATGETEGAELWKTDGTLQGTSMVKDISTGGASSKPYGFEVVNNNLIFFADDGVHGRELWKTDGTAEGTVMVKDVNEGKGNGADSMDDDGEGGGCGEC